MSRDLNSVLLEPGASVYRHPRTIELLPTRVFIHPEGSTEGKPSLTIELAAGDMQPVVYAQLTMKMFFDSLDADALVILENEWKRLNDNWGKK